MSDIDIIRARAAARARQAKTDVQDFVSPPEKPQTGLVEQGMSGVNEGIAQFAGMPVDMMAGLINGMVSRPQVESTMTVGPNGEPVPEVTGVTHEPVIKRGFGGSEDMRKLMSPFISETDPQTSGQRYARRIGQEVGFGVPAALTMGGVGPYAKAAQSNMPGYMAASAASDVAAGTAGQTAREVAPDSTMADIAATLLAGGGTAAGIAAATRSRPPAPSTQDLWDQSRQKFNEVEQSGATLTSEASDRLKQKLAQTLSDNRASPVRHPSAYSVVDDVAKRPHTTLMDVNDTRHVLGRDVAAKPEEAGIGVSLKEATEQYLDSLTNRDVSGADAAQAVEDLRAGRGLAHSAHKAQQIEGKQYRGQSRAATSGTGGNEVNAQRQNIRQVLDNEVAPTRSGRRSGYTPDEIEQMEKVVFGTPGQNALRWASRFSPTSGVLPGMLGGAGFTAAAATATSNPIMAALAALPPTAGYAAKGLAERSTRKEIAELLDIIKRGGSQTPKTASDTAKAAIVAQILAGSDVAAP